LIKDYFDINIHDEKIDEFLRDYVMSSRFRDFATIYNRPAPGRIGGEEIIVAFPLTSLEKAIPKSERIRKQIEEKYARQFERTIDDKMGKTISITVSGGIQSIREYLRLREYLISTIELDDLPKETDNKIKEVKHELRLQIDAALYIAKEMNRNRVITFEWGNK